MINTHFFRNMSAAQEQELGGGIGSFRYREGCWEEVHARVHDSPRNKGNLVIVTPVPDANLSLPFFCLLLACRTGQRFDVRQLLLDDSQTDQGHRRPQEERNVHGRHCPSQVR